jgi:hypothetical protein
VEGGEIPVLTGARRILETYHPLLYIEASTDKARARVDEFLAPYGYKLKGRFCKTPTWCYAVDAPGRTLSVTIMAHPKRESMALELAMEVIDQGLEAGIVWDNINNRWDTGRRSLLAYDATFDQVKTHHLVLQDDAVIPDNFMELVSAALAVPPDDSPICLYTGKAISRRLKTIRTNPSWLTMPGINWGVGLIIPTHHIEELVAFGDKRQEDNYDMRISRFYQEKGWRVWYPQPSLVNHRHTPSLVEGRGGRRTAHSYVGAGSRSFNAEGSVVDMKWSR